MTSEDKATRAREEVHYINEIMDLVASTQLRLPYATRLYADIKTACDIRLAELRVRVEPNASS